MGVKFELGHLERCIRDDDTDLIAGAKREKRPFLKTCHAGITELVVPVFLGTSYEGSFCMGPVREGEADCPYPAMAKAFSLGVETGFAAREAGLMSKSDAAVATSPLTSFLK